MTGLARGAGERETGVRDEGRTGIADEGEMGAGVETLENLGDAGGLVVFMEAGERGPDGEVVEKPACVTGVFAVDGLDGLQGVNCSQGDVVEIADWRGNNIKGSGHLFDGSLVARRGELEFNS